MATSFVRSVVKPRQYDAKHFLSRRLAPPTRRTVARWMIVSASLRCVLLVSACGPLEVGSPGAGILAHRDSRI